MPYCLMPWVSMAKVTPAYLALFQADYLRFLKEFETNSLGNWIQLKISFLHIFFLFGAIHKQRQQLGGGKGSKIGQNCRRIVLKYCRYGGRGVKNSETLPTLFMDGPFPHLPLLRLGYLPKWVKITPLTRTRVLQQLGYRNLRWQTTLLFYQIEP